MASPPNWRFVFSNRARKEFGKLDKTTQIRFKNQMLKMTHSTDPITGFDAKLLRGKIPNIYRYRVGDYRMLCKICKTKITIEAIKFGHRKEVYKFI